MKRRQIFTDRHSFHRRRRYRIRLPQPVAVHEAHKFQAGEQLPQGRLVNLLAQGVLRPEVDGRLTADGSQIIGQPGALLPCGQLFTDTLLDGRVTQILVHPVQGTEFQQQVRGSLGANAGYAGDVVGAVTHEGLQIDEPQRFKAVVLPELLRRITGGQSLTCLGGHQFYGDTVIDQLQAVPVAGDHDALPTLAAADPPHGADDVVGFPALAFIDGNPHGCQHLFHHRHLHSQLLRHAMAGSLIAVILQMAEGGAVEVEGHAESIRLFLLVQFIEDIQKAKNAIGKQTVPRSQGTNTIVGAVDNAVSVQNHQFHGVCSFSFAFFCRL